MYGPGGLESLAHDVIQRRLAEAAHAALVAQVAPPPPTSVAAAAAFAHRSMATITVAVAGRRRPLTSARRQLASGLRAVASRLDPGLVAEPDFAVSTRS